MPEPTKAQLLAENEALRKALKRAEAKLARETAARKQLQRQQEAGSAALTEALEQQTATSEILRVIASSPTEVQPVFDSIVKSAVQLCNAAHGVLFQEEGGMVRLAAHHNFTDEARTVMETVFPAPVGGPLPAAKVISSAEALHVADVQTAPDAAPEARRVGTLLGFRSLLIVPMMRHGRAIGALSVARSESGMLSQSQVELLQTFADQAVIAIENVRLFTELQQKNEALTKAHAQVTEALEQQTATSEILRVISSSPTDVQPVFDAIVRSTRRLCDGTFATLFRWDGLLIHLVATDNLALAQREVLSSRFPSPVDATNLVGRAIAGQCVVRIDDVDAAPDLPPASRRAARFFGYRSVVFVPMLRDGVTVGVISTSRVAPIPFSDGDVALLQTFADQAVIAIENVRLFTELQASNRDLTTALDTQTATSDILSVISRSQTDVQPVFDAIVRSAMRLLRGFSATLRQLAGDQLDLVAFSTTSESGDEALKSLSQVFLADDPLFAEAVRGRTPCFASDTETDARTASRRREVARARGYRSMLIVPMLRDDGVIGAITVTRREPGPFTNEQIGLLQTFSDQAVIAIENARLLSELQTSNRELEIKSRELEVASQHKSEFLASMSHELRTPLNAVIGFSDVLLQGMFGEMNEKQTEYQRDILASGQHLLSLINDILDLSKIEAGRMDLDLADFHLPSAIDDALLLMRERAGRRGIALERQVDERLDEIRADQRKVKQVLLNLLSNAVKFTPEGGRIDVRAALVDGTVEISVTDTGIGIAPEDQEAVFEEFKQVGKAEKKAEGTGLGLALCRKFVELHGGRIWVKSEIGAGSTFTFSIPVGVAPVSG